MPSEDCNDKKLSKITKDSLLIARLLKAFNMSGCNSSEIIAKHLTNSSNDTSELRGQLAHDLILEYDRCRAHFNDLNIRHLACSQIRAFNLSGECRWIRELMKCNTGLFTGYIMHQKECVKRETKNKLLAQLNSEGKNAWSESEVDTAIERVFMRCYMDTEPLWHPMTD